MSMKKRKIELEDRIVQDNLKLDSDSIIWDFKIKKDITVCLVGIPKDASEKHIEIVAKAYLFADFMDYNKLIEQRKIVFSNELCGYKENNRIRDILIDENMIQLFKERFYYSEIEFYKEVKEYQEHNELVDICLSRYIEFCENEINNLVIKPKNQITGFKTLLTDTQQTNLYKALKGNYIDCTEAEFKAMFTDNPQPLKWIDTGSTRHEPNKQTIFEFIYLLKEYNYLKDSKTDLITITNKNNLYRKLEFIFPEIKNFASSNNFKPIKDMPRKKELETIIKSL
jgi:hypothetical protein